MQSSSAHHQGEWPIVSVEQHDRGSLHQPRTYISMHGLSNAFDAGANRAIGGTPGSGQKDLLPSLMLRHPRNSDRTSVAVEKV